MRILITGANGQVGQALVTCAKKQAIELFAYPKNMLDITDNISLAIVIEKHQPDVVINAAAYTDVEQAENSSALAYKINADAVEVLARVCHEKNIPLLHISTDYVFDGVEKSPYIETAATNPLSIYGASKLAGEQRLFNNCEKSIVLRTSWVFSATGKNFVKTMWRLFQEKPEVRVVSDQYGGPTSAAAIAKALLTIAAQVTHPTFCDWGIYHFAGEPVVSWYNFASEIQKNCPPALMKLQCLLPITAADFPMKATRPKYSALNMQKIKQTFKIDPCDWKKELSIIIRQLNKEV